MSIEETIDIIVTHQKSISRLGDADFLLLLEEEMFPANPYSRNSTEIKRSFSM